MQKVANIAYQTTTLDSGVEEVLYAGRRLDEASKAALEHKGHCTINHFRRDGTVRQVCTFKDGQIQKAYVYD